MVKSNVGIYKIKKTIKIKRITNNIRKERWPSILDIYKSNVAKNIDLTKYGILHVSPFLPKINTKHLNESLNKISCPVTPNESLNKISCPVTPNESPNKISCPVTPNESPNNSFNLIYWSNQLIINDIDDPLILNDINDPLILNNINDPLIFNDINDPIILNDYEFIFSEYNLLYCYENLIDI